MFVVQRPRVGFGTGPITLDLSEGALQTLYLAAPPPTVIAYAIRMLKGGALWEVGTGQLSVGGSLVRSTITSNSSGNTSPIDFQTYPVEVTMLRIVTAAGAIPATIITSGASSGTVPTGATRVRISGCAAGGNGGAGAPSFLGGGGGSAQSVVDLVLPVTAGASYSWSIGAPGANTTFTFNSVTYTLLPGGTGQTSGGAAHGNGGAGGGTQGTFGTGAIAGGAAATQGWTRGPHLGGNGGGASTNNPPVGENRGSTTANGGAGGPFGVGGAANTASGNGNAATGYGAGGGGAGTSGTGGAASGGLLIFEWQS